MLRCALAVALAGCSNTGAPPPVVDVPDGYTGPVALTIESHATATRVISTPAGIDCPRTCTAEFPIGSTVHLDLASHASYFVVFYSCPTPRAAPALDRTRSHRARRARRS